MRSAGHVPLALPAERSPNVQRALGELFGGDADDRFAFGVAFGVDLILRGVGTDAGQRAPGH